MRRVLKRAVQPQVLDLQLRQADLQEVVLVLHRGVEQPVLAPLRPRHRRQRQQQRERRHPDVAALRPGAGHAHSIDFNCQMQRAK
jgi:hypothetical protein